MKILRKIKKKSVNKLIKFYYFKLDKKAIKDFGIILKNLNVVNNII